MLLSHVLFLAQVNTQAAEKLRQDINEAGKSLQEFPERGAWLNDPEIPADKYEKLLVDKQYLLIYQIKDNKVYIDYIVDCRQDYGWLRS